MYTSSDKVVDKVPHLRLYCLVCKKEASFNSTDLFDYKPSELRDRQIFIRYFTDDEASLLCADSCKEGIIDLFWGVTVHALPLRARDMTFVATQFSPC